TEFWQLAGRCISGYEIDDKAKRDFIARIAALEPQREPVVKANVDSFPAMPSTVMANGEDLSDYLQKKYSIGAEVAAVPKPISFLHDPVRGVVEPKPDVNRDIEAENQAVIDRMSRAR